MAPRPLPDGWQSSPVDPVTVEVAELSDLGAGLAVLVLQALRRGDEVPESVRVLVARIGAELVKVQR